MRSIAVALLFLSACSVVPGRADHAVEDVSFASREATLSGSIVLPAGPPVAGVVFVHGSGPQRRNLEWAHRFADAGIAALVYDKRGAGRSGGTYEGRQAVSEANLVLLADDARAALAALAAHPRLKGVPLGLTGLSQAGWIVPLAAEKNEAVRFVVLWSGPVCKVSEEDIYSIHTHDRDGTDLPTYEQALAARTEHYVWPDFLGKDSSPSDSLATLRVPGLWIFGARDGSIPVGLSIERLETLRAAGHAYDHVLVPGLGHDTVPETFGTATDWIRKTAKP